VGQALRNNPIPILIPCHRVVSTLSLGGFMGQRDPDVPELRLKRKLISLEEGYTNPTFSFLPLGGSLLLRA
jgi:methylated-DNA-[protein]-cysteine S-methyltransferase